MTELVLGSASPRRLALLEQVGLQPARILPPEIDETPRPGEGPRPYVERMAREKLAAVPAGGPAFVLVADTVVALGHRILGKPENEAEAEKFLRALSGRRHHVMTAVALATPACKVSARTVCTRVSFKRLSEEEIAGYLASGEWQGKAGGYAIQGLAGAFVKAIGGSYTNVVGLPLYETVALLKGAGFTPEK